MDPTLAVLLYASAAALVAAAGPLPLALAGRLPAGWLGWANALAAGVMLGVAYALVSVGLPGSPMHAAAGALLGIGFLGWARSVGGGDLDIEALNEASPAYGYRLLLANAMHAAPEGVAIGAAMAVAPDLGLFTAIAIALHNIPEAAVLSTMLIPRGLLRRHAAGLAVAVNVNQVLLAVVTFAIVRAAPAVLPWALGIAFGALVYLVIADLLPQCYRQAGRTGIAVVTVLAMGIVVALGGAR